MRPAAALQLKREKKAANRREIIKKRRMYLSQFGGFVGERMYLEWRRKKTGRATVPPAAQPAPVFRRELTLLERFVAFWKRLFSWGNYAAFGRTATPASQRL